MIIRFCIKGSWFHRITKRFKLDGKITSLHNWAKQSLPMANRIQCSTILLPDRERACTTSRKKPENLLKVLSMQRSYCFILSYNASIANYMILLQRLIWSIVAEHSVSAIGQRYSLKTPFITLHVNSQSINNIFLFKHVYTGAKCHDVWTKITDLAQDNWVVLDVRLAFITEQLLYTVHCKLSILCQFRAYYWSWWKRSQVRSAV